MSTSTASVSASPPAAVPERSRREAFVSRLTLLATVAAVFGQPNGLFIYFAPYPILLLLLIVFLAGVIVVTKMRSRSISLPQVNLILPTTLYFGLAILSLCYAPDPAFGGRILFSMGFKFVLFLGIVIGCVREKDFRDLLLALALLGGFFSLQGLLIILGTNLFHLQSLGNYGSVASIGAGEHNYNLMSYGILGFVKVNFVLNGLNLPRCQGLFVEPGWLSTYLELSIFATLGWFALTEYQHKRLAYWLLGLQIAALIFSLASAGWLAAGIGLGIYNGLRLFNRPGILSVRRRLFQIFAAVLVAIGLLSAVFPALPQAVYFAVYTVKFVNDGPGITSAEDRVEKASGGLRLFLERPFFGWGANQSAPLNDGKDTGNALLTAATELGVVGLGIALWMLWAIFLTLWSNMRLAYRNRSDSLIGVSAAMAGCLGAAFVHSMYLTTQWQFVYWISASLVYLNRRLLLHRENLGQ